METKSDNQLPLSSKGSYATEIAEIVYSHRAVQEFIREEKELLLELHDEVLSWNDFWIKRNKLAGPHLTTEKEVTN